MGKQIFSTLNFHGYLILHLYPIRKICNKITDTKHLCFTVFAILNHQVFVRALYFLPSFFQHKPTYPSDRITPNSPLYFMLHFHLSAPTAIYHTTSHTAYTNHTLVVYGLPLSFNKNPFAVNTVATLQLLQVFIDQNSKLVYCLKARLRNSIQNFHFLSRPEPFVRWRASAFFITSTYIAVSGICTWNLWIASPLL